MLLEGGSQCEGHQFVTFAGKLIHPCSFALDVYSHYPGAYPRQVPSKSFKHIHMLLKNLRLEYDKPPFQGFLAPLLKSAPHLKVLVSLGWSFGYPDVTIPASLESKLSGCHFQKKTTLQRVHV